MTETPATTTSTAPVFPPGRYGRRRAPRRRRPWLAALLALAAVVAGTAVTVRLYRLYGDPTYDPKVITYTGITDREIVVDFQVTVPAGGSAECLLRARSRNGAEVGRAEVTVHAEPGQNRIITSYRLATTERPFIGEVTRCRAAG